MKPSLCSTALAGGLLSAQSFATGLATCDSGPQEAWQSQATLEKQLTQQGWQVRKIKVDGGCYEVYALNEKGERVEAYFQPKTLAPGHANHQRQGPAHESPARRPDQ